MFAFRCKFGTALPIIKNTKKKNTHKNTPKNIHLNNFLKKHTQKKPNKQKQMELFHIHIDFYIQNKI